MDPAKTKVLLVKGNWPLCNAANTYLSEQADIEVVGVAHDETDVCGQITALLPDVVLMDGIMLTVQRFAMESLLPLIRQRTTVQSETANQSSQTALNCA